MQRIDKGADQIISAKYKSWLDKLEAQGKTHPLSRTYYDDVAMNLYRCQKGVCAYTEMYICPPDLYAEGNWTEGRYRIPDNAKYSRIDHLGEMDHYDPDLKKDKYWLWENLFMIHAKINGIKSKKVVVQYLKPDLEDYSPEKYFDYDENTHLYVPNVEIEDEEKRAEIQNMIDHVLFLNHGAVRNERRDFINSLKQKKEHGSEYIIDRFFTAVKQCL